MLNNRLLPSSSYLRSFLLFSHSISFHSRVFIRFTHPLVFLFCPPLPLLAASTPHRFRLCPLHSVLVLVVVVAALPSPGRSVRAFNVSGTWICHLTHFIRIFREYVRNEMLEIFASSNNIGLYVSAHGNICSSGAEKEQKKKGISVWVFLLQPQFLLFDILA